MVNRPEASPQIEISRKSATLRNMAASGGTDPTVITSTEPPTMASIAGGPDGNDAEFHVDARREALILHQPVHAEGIGRDDPDPDLLIGGVRLAHEDIRRRESGGGGGRRSEERPSWSLEMDFISACLPYPSLVA